MNSSRLPRCSSTIIRRSAKRSSKFSVRMRNSTIKPIMFFFVLLKEGKERRKCKRNVTKYPEKGNVYIVVYFIFVESEDLQAHLKIFVGDDLDTFFEKQLSFALCRRKVCNEFILSVVDTDQVVHRLSPFTVFNKITVYCCPFCECCDSHLPIKDKKYLVLTATLAEDVALGINKKMVLFLYPLFLQESSSFLFYL